MINETRTQFYSRKIEESNGDQKSLYKITNKLLHREKECSLPSHDSLDELGEKFANFVLTRLPRSDKILNPNAQKNIRCIPALHM
jgi:hypothetical protein